MEISIEWFTASEWPSFNVSLATAEGKEPFITIKSCRIVQSAKGEFLGWPSTKNAKTDKYWHHVTSSDAFSSVVLAKAKESMPTKQVSKPSGKPDDFNSDVPY